MKKLRNELRVYVYLDLKKDKTLIEYLKETKNRNSFMKELIRKDKDANG